MYKHFLYIGSFLLILTSVSFAEAPPIKIGVISGLGGIAAKWDRYQNMGITLAQEELAQRGQEISIILEDSQTLGTKAVSAFNKLIDFDHVDGILADDFGFAIAPLLPLVGQRKIFFVTTSLPHDRYCSQAVGYFYSITSQFALTRDAFSRFFELNSNVKKIGLVVFDDKEWGNTYRTIWKDIAKERGVEIVDEFLSNEAVPDFKSPVAKMLSKKT